jgi:hypothetical protein
MVRRHAGRTRTSEISVGVTVAALEQRHKKQCGEQNGARQASDAMAKTVH